ncbi:hypothetical protein D8B26_008248 [Coccidioides posadasii str. Silveira]|uniref:F1F0 ATP synthase assembly protein Atp11 n=3 Tax=Coccidioides posadasii TaxID=199306 RepID=E9DGM9_COCPS|nr:hypothetical protein CPC735_043680 [Coccidioides posadasii C735 delta SOWgp]EER25924.1 hypothetical protein CPC735_043680 [Coccidioides posadasii C735 delta SOWgp]EFW14390.1 F1F0 ATP synthase assembly protein Atp11 [Coccidioides posadasii str. Silveira]KMM69644.1 ATP11 protein [Coccidioides posadasii RMSCC 3488]QVM13640.1 hypothetical protein D8B26_008248 [Coccidioides posadasii str. Silveira]|eukprot:XP_003068069.1 hypothetical protein CPC735_043680 [Coccidioides posadasii C735 delta SOWgp]
MALRSPAFRNLLGFHTSISPVKHIQRRWAQVHDVRFVATHQPNNVLARYKDKLDQKAKQEGHSSISSLKEAYQDKIQAVRVADALQSTPPQPNPTQPVSPSSSPRSQTTQASRVSSSRGKSATPGIKPLSAYLDIQKILTLPQKEIETLWRLRHAPNPNSVCATIPLETYHRIIKTAKQNPQFILPLPREIETPAEDANSSNGSSTQTATAAEMHFLQWGFHPPSSTPTATPTSPDFRTENTHTSTVIFTHLASYKLHGAYSQPHTIITHHLDLADEKGLVLMNGTVVPDRGVSLDEAKLLIMWLQRFYDWGVDGSQGGRKGEMLRMFSRGDVEGFKVEDLVEEVERV